MASWIVVTSREFEFRYYIEAESLAGALDVLRESQGQEREPDIICGDLAQENFVGGWRRADADNEVGSWQGYDRTNEVGDGWVARPRVTRGVMNLSEDS